VAEQVKSAAPSTQGTPVDPANDPDRELKREIAQVLAKTEDTWRQIFLQSGSQYRDPGLVLFSGATPTACGTGDAAMGPFYCPGDHKVYLDMKFFAELERRFRAAGDFARAYVIAHEVGHHVQNLMGISKKTNQLRSQLSEKDYNKVSVRVELQADCFAGVWAHHAHKAKPFIEPGDIEEAMRAATAIGDDALQKQAQGRVVPDSFTHGTSEQRVRWFKTGFESGNLKQCDTFAARNV
jgi:predicted metalloprotease